MRSKEVRLLLTCLVAPNCTVAFEPLGSVHTLNQDDIFHVEIFGPGSGEVEVSYRPDGISVGAWSGADVRVRDKSGSELQT